MRYWFNGDDAQRYGLPAAAVLAHIRYWIERNTHAGDAPCVTQGIKEMVHYLPFLSASQIKRSLSKLESGGAIYRTQSGFDRRATYCLGTESSNAWDEKGEKSGQNDLIDGTDSSRVLIEINTSKKKESNAREWERPNEEEVIEYLQEIGGSDLAHTLGPAFFNYYEANGWMVNGTPIAKWRPKARQWLTTERNRQSNERQKGFNPKGFTPEGLKDFIDNG